MKVGFSHSSPSEYFCVKKDINVSGPGPLAHTFWLRPFLPKPSGSGPRTDGQWLDGQMAALHIRHQLTSRLKALNCAFEFFFCFLKGKQGSGPNRGKDLYILEIICLSACPLSALRPRWLGCGFAGWPGRA